MEEKDVRQWCMFMHLSQFAGYLVPFAGIVVPIVMWQTKKDEAPEIDAHGRAIVNAMISFFIYIVLALLLCFVFVGFLLLPILVIAAVAFPVIGAIKANDGVFWPYPFMLKLL